MKSLQKKRMWEYFINATTSIIQEEGLSAVTIRKVATKAGYNSATIYNYFQELSHLIFFAATKLLRPYVEDVGKWITSDLPPLQKYDQLWEIFCKWSFQHPDLFHAVFLMDLGEQPNDLLEEYYKVFPADLIDVPAELKPFLFQHNIQNRGRTMLSQAVNAGELTEDAAQLINELTILIWKGMITDLLNNRSRYTPQEATEQTMIYIRAIIEKWA